MRQPQEPNIEDARKIALRMLESSVRSKREIEQKLQRAGASEAIVEQVIAEIEARGLVDDTTFAQDWVEDRADRKGYGKRRLSLELQRKGIDKTTIQETLDKVEPEDEKRRALALIEKKWTNSGEPADISREKRRLTDYLLRRGFSYDVIRQVFSELALNFEAD